jgi:hypothetical protein
MKFVFTLLLFTATASGQWQRTDRAYQDGTRALDHSKWEEAVKLFSLEADRKGSRADGALYWKAYAESRMGHRDAALASLATLRRDYAASRWLNDAQALEVEVKQQNGSPVSPDAEQNDDLKMLALNGLLHNDPDQAVPIIEKLLRKSTSRKLKENALFVLSQSKSPKAGQVLHEAANGAFNPDVQLQAIQMYGVGRGNSDELLKIYGTAKEPDVKKAVAEALFIQHNAKALIELARKEPNGAIKQNLVEKLFIMRSPEATAYLVEILNK